MPFCIEGVIGRLRDASRAIAPVARERKRATVAFRLSYGKGAPAAAARAQGRLELVSGHFHPPN
jgi:hypothetical protein